MSDNLRFASLKEKHRKLRDNFPQETSLRVHRALSWIERAELEQSKDPDAAFIFYWISFNAAYAAEIDITLQTSARERFEHFFYKLQELDQDERIYNLIWMEFSASIRSLLNNQFVFNPFWVSQNSLENDNSWQDSFEAAKRKAHSALSTKDTKVILCLLFDRLYVLRNQVLHGGATWGGGVNRDQIKDGANILASMVPIFVNIMMDNPEHDWGVPHFKVIE